MITHRLRLTALAAACAGVALAMHPASAKADEGACAAPIDFSDASQAPRAANAPPSGRSIYLGCGTQPCPPEKLRAANASSFIDKADPPVLIIHGDADTLVPLKQSQMFYDALQKGGVKSELVVVPGVNHIFAGGTDAQGKQIFDKVMAFLDATTGVKPAQ